MSISKLRGCFSFLGPIVVIVVGGVLLIGFLWTGNRGGGPGPSIDEKARLGNAMFSVAGVDVHEGTLRDGVNGYLQQALQQKAQEKQLPEITPIEQLGFYTSSVTASIGEAILKSVIKKEGIEVGEDDIVAFLVKNQEDAIGQQRSQFDVIKNIRTQMAQKAYDDAKKKDATSKDTKDKLKALEETQKSTFEEDFKKQNNGMTPQQAIESIKERAPEVFKEPQAKKYYELQAMLNRLRAKLGEGVDTSDTALKKTYDKVVYQQIAMTSGGKAKGDEVLKKIREGMSFKDAATQFTTLKDATGKPNTNDVTQVRYELQNLEGFKALLSMEPGDVSEVQMIGTTAYIFKLIEIKPDVPKDFETIKQQRAKELRDSHAQTALTKLIEDTKKSAVTSIKWNDEGWKLAYDWSDITTGDKSKEISGTENRQKRIAAYKEFVTRSKDTVSAVSDIAPLVRYAALQQLDVEYTGGAEDTEIRKQLDEATEEIVTLFPSTQLRTQLAVRFIEGKQGDRALEQLLEIAKSAYPAGPNTQELVGQVEKLLPRAANVASKDTKLIADIQKELEQWRQEDKERKEAEVKARAEEARLKEENAKEEAELKKKEGVKAPPNAPPTAPPTTPPTKPGG